MPLFSGCGREDLRESWWYFEARGDFPPVPVLPTTAPSSPRPPSAPAVSGPTARLCADESRERLPAATTSFAFRISPTSRSPRVAGAVCAPRPCLLRQHTGVWPATTASHRSLTAPRPARRRRRARTTGIRARSPSDALLPAHDGWRHRRARSSGSPRGSATVRSSGIAATIR